MAKNGLKRRPQISSTLNLDDLESQPPRISTTLNLNNPESRQPRNSILKGEGQKGASSDFYDFFTEQQLYLLVF